MVNPLRTILLMTASVQEKYAENMQNNRFKKISNDERNERD